MKMCMTQHRFLMPSRDVKPLIFKFIFTQFIVVSHRVLKLSLIPNSIYLFDL